MRLAICTTVLFGLCLSQMAQAGPWLREKGSGFASFSLTLNRDKTLGQASYLEFGLSEKMTVGADISYFQEEEAGTQKGFGTLFLRRALGKNEGRSRWAYELGLGTDWEGTLLRPHIKTGVSWGRGFERWGKGGWMTVDASVKWGVSHSRHVAKVDATLGLNFTEKSTGMMQLYLTHQDSDVFATLAPSWVFSPRKGRFRVQIGGEIPLEEAQDAALKLGIWREF